MMIATATLNKTLMFGIYEIRKTSKLYLKTKMIFTIFALDLDPEMTGIFQTSSNKLLAKELNRDGYYCMDSLFQLGPIYI